MRLTVRDAVATVAVGAMLILYGLWLSDRFAVGTRTMALIGFGLGWVACTSNAAETKNVYGVGNRRVPRYYTVLASTLGAVALVAGVLAIAIAGEVLLATFVIATGLLWLGSTLRHGRAGATSF